ncbi:MAG: hypothetical protein IKR73_06925 [Oscillospiraceae bacterium]|nr:hypothetical protein [Oscillospiraceae bacterium]
MKKRILVCALAAVFAAGCAQQTAENSIPTMETTTLITEEEPVDADAESVTEAAPEVEDTVEETKTEKATETEATEPAVTEAPEPEMGTITNEDIESTADMLTAASSWTETAMSAVMYVKQTDNNTGTVYARERAVIGSTPIATYHDGDKVEVIAVTDTGYYKIKSGAFIHTDYLTSDYVDKNGNVKKRKKVTTVTEEEELIDDGDTQETTVTEEAPKKKKKKTTEETVPAPEATWADPSMLPAPTGASALNDEKMNLNGTVITLGNYKVDYTTRYAYKQLSEVEQQFYGDVVAAVMSLNSGIGYRQGLTAEQALRVYITVLNNEPELFWMSGAGVMTMSSSMIFSFKEQNIETLHSMQDEIDTAAAKIVKKAGKKSTINKLKVIFDTIVDMNDFSLSSEGYNISIYNGLHGTKKGQLQCAGYAKTVQYLCDMLGVQSTVVIGTTSEGESHAWNVVSVDGKWYNFDTTWGDPINSWDSKYKQYEFFLVPDKWIHNITHFNINNFVRNTGEKIHLFDPPACTQYAANYFYLSGIDLHFDNKTDADKALKAQVDKAISNGTYVCEVMVTDKNVYDQMMSESYWKAIQKYAKSKSSKVDKVKRQSSYTMGVMVVHYDIVYK